MDIKLQEQSQSLRTSAAMPLRWYRWWVLWAALAVVAVLAAPSIWSMVPAYEDHLGENYQPLRALKFFHSRGTAFHKYGPMNNFLLAPGYGASLLYWRLIGQFQSPAEAFPYGFARPLEQLTFLIVQGRIVVLGLSLAMLGLLVMNLRLITPRGPLILAGFLLSIGTDYAAAVSFANTRPDGPMLAFCAAALAVYLRIVYLGLTPRRALALSALAVCAISSKELAGPVWVLPYLGLGWAQWQQSRHDPQDRRRFFQSVSVALVTGVAGYALLNIVYAPGTWWQRMQFWLVGVGKDSAVWGGELTTPSGSVWGYLGQIGTSLLNNLGPAGSVAAVAAIAAILMLRPRRWVLLSLPFLSLMALGLVPMGYVADRFYTLAALTLTPMMVAGLTAAWERLAQPRSRQALAAALGLAVAVNLLWGTFAWHYLDMNWLRVAEREVHARVEPDTPVYLLALHRHVPGKSRLEAQGYQLDPRPLQAIVDAPADQRPAWVLAEQGQLQF
ncbi:MAG TPA: hypothetical protein VF184_01505, partial [Phycisphaeraceae bacterium]